MKTNPIITLANSGFKITNKVWAIPNTYSLTIQSNASGTASSDALIGTENYSTNLYVTPSEGYKLSGWNITGGSVSDNVFTFGNVDATIEPVFEEGIITITAGWTLATNGAARPTLDPNPGASKNPYVTTTQLDGDYVSSYYPNQQWNDQFNMFCPSAGIWNITLNNWQEFTSYYMRQDFGAGTTATVTGLITIDFFGKKRFGTNDEYTMNRCMQNIQYIPSSTTALFNTNNLSSVAYSFANCTKITGALIPFITAMQASCPNLTNVTDCFYGCTAASDYNQATALYPDWF